MVKKEISEPIKRDGTTLVVRPMKDDGSVIAEIAFVEWLTRLTLRFDILSSDLNKRLPNETDYSTTDLLTRT